ncbi:hypothetical protein pEaSNUABM11_00283 [Erwinia phage pEa_SNUABM_11]|nr:hypothetical protein pEaSNUABM11_00283 [Erwinia phage pEa_SNUABM_11]
MPILGTIEQIHVMPPEPVAETVLAVLEKNPQKFPLGAIVEVGISFEFRENFIPLEFYDFHSHTFPIKMTEKVPYCEIRVSWFTPKEVKDAAQES